jgi:1,4-dihydroxy-2-naphthoate octaprenyltransferase
MMLIALVPDLELRVFGVLGLTLAWFYTAPPLRLNYRGFGELTTGVTLYGMAPIGVYYLQAHAFSSTLFSVVGSLFLFQVSRQFLMNLSDIDGDRQVGKRTVAVILGPDRLVRLYRAVQITAYCVIAALGLLGVLPGLVALVMLCTMPFPMWISRQLSTGAMRDPARANAVTFWASMQLPAVVCSAMISLLLDAVLYQPDGRYLGWIGVCVGTMLVCSTWVVGWVLAKPRLRAEAGSAPDPESVRR